ncbi:MAG TPA: carboxypeptidase regulatory-like domain-containing protein [Candidatus Angelobacter sp.]|nr:carboxypeptidase regulatory-like domain-containing protein [Candidatus Angelobacter sp.]
MHAALLPDGRVFFISYYAESLQPYIWDPSSNTFTTTAASSFALFCSGHTDLADGRILLAGGHVADYVGYAHAVIYDPTNNTFTTLPDMNAARWYPTATTLPNGDVLVVSGDINSNTNVDPLPQVFQFSTQTWRNLTSAQLAMPLYPNMLVAPNGLVFNAGPSRQTRYLDTSGTGAWSNVAVLNFTGFRDYGPALMYDLGKVVAIGGADPPTATTEVIDLNAATPAWKYTGSMQYPRRQHNAVILPDGKVLIVGGSSAAGFDTSTSPVLPAEMWDPATGQFTVMASIATYRGYHSTALLLPDGTVLSAGGNVGGPNAQIFSPPYLFAGPRPAITSAPVSAGYGQTVFVASPDAASISQVTLLRQASVTHTNNMSQGFLSLSFTQTSTGLNVAMPANANLAQPGYYMLFILNSAGVPSTGSIIQISPTAAAIGTVTGKVTSTYGAAISGASVSSGGSKAVTGADGGYTLQMPPGDATLTASLAGYQNASENVTVSEESTQADVLAIQPINPGNVTGLVTDSNGAPLPGATLTAGGLAAIAANDGSYALNYLPAGQTTISAALTGFQPGSATVNVLADSTTTAPMIALISSSGTITGTVKSSSGAAIAGASIQYGGGIATSDASGSYSLSGVPVGTVQLVASANGFQSATQSVAVNGGSITTANFSLTAVPTNGTVTGQVTNISNGAIIAGASVIWSGGTATSDASGIYTLANVTGGNQNITASKSGYLSRTITAAVSPGTTSTLNFPLATSGKISVKVVTSGGAVVSGATVTIKGGVIATTVSGLSGSTGFFTTNWIPVGTYTVTVAKSGFATQTKTTTVSSGVTTSLTFTGF